MTIEKAIAHFSKIGRQKTQSCEIFEKICGEHYLQITDWLIELVNLREEKRSDKSDD